MGRTRNEVHHLSSDPRSGTVLIFGSRQPAGADPIPKSKEPEVPPLLARAPAAKKAPPADALAVKVKEAQDKAIAYLKSQQKEKRKDISNWENDTLTVLQTGGSSALAVLALLESGLKPDDPAVASGLKYLRTLPPRHTYVVSLQTQAFCKANQKEDADRIKENVKWLEESAIWNKGQLVGWTYTGGSGSRSDNSNTRYAVSALYAAQSVGFKVQKAKFWEAVRDYYVQNQVAGGSWTYQNQGNRGTHTMTLAGVLALTQTKDILGKEDKQTENAQTGRLRLDC